MYIHIYIYVYTYIPLYFYVSSTVLRRIDSQTSYVYTYIHTIILVRIAVYARGKMFL
jgi:hypothetical protein